MKHSRGDSPHYDVIVIGGGHAGIEACVASARLGCKTLLISQDFISIGRLSCNPSIGGSAKGHLVKEIDALGGVMPFIADRSGLLFKMLNRSKGPAVWSPRSQNDKDLYPYYAQQIIWNTKNLYVARETVQNISLQGGRVHSVSTESNEEIFAKAIVLCSGTFLNGILHTGQTQVSGGRVGEKAIVGISDALNSLGIERGRLKTGTPPRVDIRSLDLSGTETVYGDDDPEPFSVRTEQVRNLMCCNLTHTNSKTHEILASGFADSPMYSGRITGAGPRYCPSIEDKINRFAERESHQIVLEPEGLHTDSVYVNGFSTSLSQEVQDKALRTIPGLEKCQVQRYGYAVEYDFFFPYQLRHSLESKAIGGLFFAGQINGTSGYEEAAAQGLIAGVNAAHSVLDREALRLSRSESYIGVMIDDLVNKNTEEPYRIFTSLAEYRLLLRQDNAAERLMKYGIQLGLVSKEIGDKNNASILHTKNLREFCDQEKISLSSVTRNSREFGGLESGDVLESGEAIKNVQSELKSITELCKRPENSLHTLLLAAEKYSTRQPAPFIKNHSITRTVEFNIKYEGYLKRMMSDIESFKKAENRKIPDDFDYSQLNSISTEALLKLKKIRPETLGQASRISGVSATDLSILTLYLTR